MSIGKTFHVPKLTLLGAIVFLIGLAVCLVLLGNDSSNVTAVITLITAAVVPILLGLYQAQLNGTKADAAASAAHEAKGTAVATSVVTGEIKQLVNGGLEDRIRSVLVGILEDHLGIPSQPSPPAAETTSSPQPPFPVAGS